MSVLLLSVSLIFSLLSVKFILQQNYVNVRMSSWILKASFNLLSYGEGVRPETPIFYFNKI